MLSGILELTVPSQAWRVGECFRGNFRPAICWQQKASDSLCESSSGFGLYYKAVRIAHPLAVGRGSRVTGSSASARWFLAQVNQYSFNGWLILDTSQYLYLVATVLADLDINAEYSL